MWGKIKEKKYMTIAKYYFLGIVLAVIVFQFVTKSMHNSGLDFNFLIEKEILKYIIVTLIGGFFGGFVFMLMTMNKNDKQIKDEILWANLKEKNKLFFIKNIIAFSTGGFVYILMGNIFDISSYDNILYMLFSKDHIIDYIGIISAMSVLAIFISVGIKKRLNLLFEK